MRAAAGLAAAAAVAGCALVPAAGPSAGPEPLPPPGYGSLRQVDVSVSLVSGDLEIMVTPLEESVILVTAPDTYRRLHGLAETHGPRVADGSGPGVPKLFLVSFYTDAQGTSFVPEELQLRSRGQRLRPRSIVPVTPGWGQNRVRQRETEMGVYAFDGPVDLETDLVVSYGLVESSQWSAVLPRVRAERARARARAGEE